MTTNNLSSVGLLVSGDQGLPITRSAAARSSWTKRARRLLHLAVTAARRRIQQSPRLPPGMPAVRQGMGETPDDVCPPPRQEHNASRQGSAPVPSEGAGSRSPRKGRAECLRATVPAEDEAGLGALLDRAPRSVVGEGRGSGERFVAIRLSRVRPADESSVAKLWLWWADVCCVGRSSVCC